MDTGTMVRVYRDWCKVKGSIVADAPLERKIRQDIAQARGCGLCYGPLLR